MPDRFIVAAPGLDQAVTPWAAPRGMVRTAKYFPEPFGLVEPFLNAPTGCTLGTLWTLEDDFDLVRFMVGNDQLDAASVVSGLVFAPSAAVNDGYNPVDAFGNAVEFTPVTFNGSGADLPPDQIPDGDTRSLAVPACANRAVPVLRWSDWMRVPSYFRTDGGVGRLLMVRQYAAPDTVSRVAGASEASLAAWENVCQGRRMLSFLKYFGDGVSRPESFIAPVPDCRIVPVAVQYYARTKGVTLAVHGDSITAGAHSTSGFAGWPFLSAMALSTPARPIQLFNQGHGGQRGPNFYLNALTTIPATRPDVVTIATWTPNDGGTQEAADIAFRNAMHVVEVARQYGAVPILITPIPCVSYTVAQDTVRMTAVTRAREAEAAGILVCDMNAAMTDGASPQRIPADLCTDGVHPNDAGYSVMAAAFEPVFKRAVALVDGDLASPPA
jgi:lysophospholipase L1-like esterase